ncbi:chromate transporter [Oribacterium sp. C9]|uniref:chromate transporter n=1 Tax=Oribacterium sp. C9 TaxID=1943579 RepID=UPI001FA8473A|nr:chromate transporter [Oribacterium sp. C9]
MKQTAAIMSMVRDIPAVTADATTDIMNKLTDLFLTFAKIGLFTFGGGYAMISVMQEECVNRKKWVSDEELMNVTVMAESTPGPIAINCATYVGYRQSGMIGAVVSTLGLIIPSFCIILLLSAFLSDFLKIKIVADAFRGIKIAVGILMVDAAIKMLRKKTFKPLQRMLVAGSFLIMLTSGITAVRISSIAVMLTGAVVNLMVFLIKNGGKGK